MTLVDRIKIKCKEKNTSMNALEHELGFGNGTLRRWNERTPGADRLLILANRLDTSIDWLLTGKDNNANIHLSQSEHKLLDLYRNTNDIGQPLIIKHASDLQSALPRNSNTAREEPISSTSKIG